MSIAGLYKIYGVSLEEKINIFINLNGELIKTKIDNSVDFNETRFGELLLRVVPFKANITLPKCRKNIIELVVKIRDYTITLRKIRFGKYFPLVNNLKKSYVNLGDYYISYKDYKLLLYRKSFLIKIKNELMLFLELLSIKSIASKKAIILRFIYCLGKHNLFNNIWLISDRLSKADDNGEAFFKYLNNINKNIKPYFVISKHCRSYNYLKSYGNVVEAYSWKHKFLQLFTDIVISSQTDEVFRNPFGKNAFLYHDFLYKTKFVFLQHGIITTDLSKWLCKSRQNISGFVTSSNKEKELILEGNYNYTDKEVWLTGLPRFDYLRDSKEKLITIIPTWRKYLALQQNHETGIWDLAPNFSESKYAVFYRNLLCNDRLLGAAERCGYKIQFKIHPSFLSKADAFKFPPSVSIVDDSTSYRDIYEKSSLLVTDYSSSVYDFLYLRKPIFYCQFDKDEFFNGEHMGIESSFNYENDGFGEVEYTLESTVERIIEYMENDCVLKDIYKERIDNFFAFNDRKNCERVYNAILSMDKK